MDFPAMDDASMDDAALVQRASEGQTAAFDALFQRYGGRVQDFLAWVLQDQEEAGYVLYDTFTEAAARIDELVEPSRFRPWIFAVASRQALRHRAGAGGAAPATAVDDGAWGELLQVVRAVGRELTPRERALLDLHYRQGLEGDALADAVGAPPDEATVQLDRLTGRVEQALGVNVVAHLGARDCPELKVLLADWDGRLDTRQRTMVEEHAERCSICGPRRRKHIPASALLGVAPAAAIPSGLRERLIEDVDLAGHRGRRWSARRGGFPPSMLGTHDLRRRVVAAAAAVILVATAAFLVTRDSGNGEQVASVNTTIRPTTTLAGRTTTVPPSSSSTSTPEDGGGSGAGEGATGRAAGGGGSSTGGGSSVGGSTGGGSSGGGSGGGGSGGGGSGSGGGGDGGGGTGTSSTTVTAPATTTTVPPPDENPPSLSGLSVSPSSVRASGCSGGGATTATVSVTATDASGISSVRATVAAPGGGGTNMASVGGGVYRATIGPFESPLPAGFDLEGQVIVTATDSAGNTASINAGLTIVCPS